MIDTFWPFWLPAFMGDSFQIFLMRQFMLGIPRDLDEAAYIDGCSPVRLFGNIIAPLCKPVMSVCFIFMFVAYWNSFMGPLIFLSRSNNFPLTLTISAIAQEVYQLPPWNLIMLLCFLAAIPLFVVFFILQKNIVSGIVMSGIKE